MTVSSNFCFPTQALRFETMTPAEEIVEGNRRVPV